MEIEIRGGILWLAFVPVLNGEKRRSALNMALIYFPLSPISVAVSSFKCFVLLCEFAIRSPVPCWLFWALLSSSSSS